MNAGAILLQAIDVNDLVTLNSVKELGFSAIFLFIIVILYRKLIASEEKCDAKIKECDARIDAISKQRDEDYKKYVEMRNEDTRKYVELVIATNKIIDECSRTMQRIEKVLDK